MEREKQKKIDKERQKREREDYLRKKREEEEQVLNNMERLDPTKVMALKKSKFDTDSDDEEAKKHQEKNFSLVKQRKSRFQNADSPDNSPRKTTKSEKEPSPPPEPPKSREEMIEEVVSVDRYCSDGMRCVIGN